MGHALKVRFNDRRDPMCVWLGSRTDAQPVKHAWLTRAFSANPFTIAVLGLRPRLF